MHRLRTLALLPLLAACGSGGGGDDDSADATPGAGHWEARAATLGGPVQETATVELRGKIYVIGGFRALQVLDQVIVYDPATDTWSTAAPTPEPIHHANAAVAGDRIYVVGAMQLDGFSFTPIGDVWEYDPDLDQWTARTSLPAGAERGSAAVAAIDGIIYVAGGLTAAGATDLVSAYDPGADAWTHPLAPLPIARDHGGGATAGGLLYAIGGRGGAIASRDPRTFAYDPSTDAWTELAPMPTARGGIGVGVVDGRILAVGGEGNPDTASGVYAQTESYDPATDTWTTHAPMTTPRHGMGVVGAGGALHVPGGGDVEGFGAVDTHELFIP